MKSAPILLFIYNRPLHTPQTVPPIVKYLPYRIPTEVFIKTDSLGIDNYDQESPMTCNELYFVKRGAVVTGSYVYDNPRDENDHRLIPFSAVDPIVYSEALCEVKKYWEIQT